MSKTVENLEGRIAAQKRKLEELRTQKALLEAKRKKAANKIARAADTRRKILAGAALLNAVGIGKVSQAAFVELLDPILKKQEDRILFSLPSNLHEALPTNTSDRP